MSNLNGISICAGVRKQNGHWQSSAGGGMKSIVFHGYEHISGNQRPLVFTLDYVVNEGVTVNKTFNIRLRCDATTEDPITWSEWMVYGGFATHYSGNPGTITNTVRLNKQWKNQYNEVINSISASQYTDGVGYGWPLMKPSVTYTLQFRMNHTAYDRDRETSKSVYNIIPVTITLNPDDASLLASKRVTMNAGEISFSLNIQFTIPPITDADLLQAFEGKTNTIEFYPFIYVATSDSPDIWPVTKYSIT